MSATGLAQEKVTRYLADQARAGRRVNTTDLDVISIDVDGRGTVGVVLPKSDSVRDMRVVLDGDDQPVFFGAIFADESEDATPSDAAAPGYDGGINKSGMSRTNEACRDLWWSAEYRTQSNADHHVYDCWEKWRDTRNSRQWVYNRYTLFDPANGDWGWKGEIIDATIRSRPWKGYEDRVYAGPYNYAPTPSDSCTTYTATIGSPSGSSLSVPSVQCSAKISVFPNGDVHSFGTDWNGRTTGQVYLDEAFRIVTPYSGAPAPIYADYVWMEIQYCWGIGPCYDGPSEYEKWTNTGW